MSDLQVQTMSTIAEVESAQLDQQITTAKRYPRDEEKSVAKSIKLACYNVKTAQSCIYFRPVGKDKSGKQTFAEGPSIRLAEVIKSSWGNLRCGTRVSGERDGMVFVQAVCHDLENNVFETSEVGKSIVGRNGRYPDTMIQVVIAAASKIALRNVIFSVVPKVYAEQVLDACKEQICGTEEDKASLMADLISSFAEIGITSENLFDAIDRKLYAPGSNDELVFLIGLHNAIKDGICTTEDIFGKKTSAPQSTKPVIDPNQIQEKPKEKKREPITTKPKVNTVMDFTDFLAVMTSFSMQLGKTVDQMNSIIEAEFSIPEMNQIPTDMQSQIIDYFTSLVNNKL